jgi:hypothetical protein
MSSYIKLKFENPIPQPLPLMQRRGVIFFRVSPLLGKKMTRLEVNN